ncbi:uncharacterized protein [Argopecten irradians]|uniref:uncharacterized protein n=1 Tax=Argopecten irradians TaxID=31199 RepID=UPI0037191E51
MSEEVLNNFLDHIQSYIENTPDLSLLIKKRFKECSESYIQSSKFEDSLHATQAKIDSDNSRVFVYLRDFLNELKSNKAERKLKKKRKLLDTGFDSSEAPSPKSVCSNDTDCSVVEIDEIFSQAQQQHNKVNKLSLKHSKQNCENVDKSELPQGVLNGHCEGEGTVKARKSNREESRSPTKHGESNNTESDKLKTLESNKEESTGHKLLGTSCFNDLVQISDGEKSVEDLVLPDIPNNIDKSKGSSNSNVKNDEIECITIDDDDDEEEGDSVELLPEESIKEIKTKVSQVLFGSLAENFVSEHSNNNDTKQSSSLKEAKEQICSGNTEKICDELKKEYVEITSNIEGEGKKPKRVEIKTLELHQTGNGNNQTTDGVQEGSTSETVCTDSQEESATTVTDSMERESSEPVKKGSQRQIRRLENLLEDIRNKIELLKNADLSLDALGEEDSAYIQEDRYQQKFVKVWRKLCELKGAESSTGRPIEKRFYYKGTRYPEVNRNLERFINKHKIFPDFHDVQKVIRDTSKKKKLGLSGPAIDRLAREAFQDIGDLLQKRRISDLRKTSLGHLPEEQGVREDPALKDPDLKKKLDQNRKVAKGKLDDVLEKFCKWQEEAPPVDENEDINKKSEDEEEEEENQEEMDVPELTAILNDSEEEASASPIKTSTSPRKTTDGSSSSVCDSSDTALRHSPRFTDRKAASPHSSSGSHQVSNDKISSDNSPNPRSPYVVNSPDPMAPDMPNSPDPMSPDVANSSELGSPYVVNSPDPMSPDVTNLPDSMSPDVANPLDSTSPDVANSPQDLPMAYDSSDKPKSSLLSIEDYMDHMPVLKTSHSDYDLQISDIRSIVEDSTENQQGSSLPNSLKEGAKRQLRWPAENDTRGGSDDVDHGKSVYLHSDQECKSSPRSNKKHETHSTNDRSDNGEVSSTVYDLSSTQRSIMFRNSRKLLSLKPLNRKTTVIDLAGEEEQDVVSIPNKQITGSSNSHDDDVIVLSDSD